MPSCSRLSIVHGTAVPTKIFGVFLTALLAVVTAAFLPVYRREGTTVWALFATLAVAALLGSMWRGFGGVRIRKDRGEVVRWWGPMAFGLLPVPLFWRRRRLSSFEWVVRRVEVHEIHDSGSDRSYESFPVFIEGPGVALLLYDGLRLLAARRVAERAARVGGLPLVDEVDGSPTREPGELDLSLLERLAASGVVPTTLGAAPTGIEVREEADAVEYVVPLPASYRSWPAALLRVDLMALATLLFFGGRELVVGRGLDAVAIVCFTAALPVAAHLGALLRFGVQPERVRLEPRELVVRRCSSGVPSTRRIPLAELEELVVDGGALFAVSDRRRFSFAHGLDPDAKAWLRAELIHRWWTIERRRPTEATTDAIGPTSRQTLLDG